MNWFPLAILAFLLPFWAFRLWLWQKPRRKMRADIAAFKRELERTNPPGPPLTPEEKAGFHAYVAGLAMPAAELTPREGTMHAGGNRLGGPVWLAEGEAWPVGRNGLAMEFLLQLDFGDLPPLPDFPAQGVLQFFVANDDMNGMDLDDLANGDIALQWRDDVAGPGRMETPPPLPGRDVNCSPWVDDAARAHGRPLDATAVLQQAVWGDWRIDARWEGWLNRPGFQELEDSVMEPPGAPRQCHHVGGQPVYVQDDVRRDPRYRAYDRCLLRLTSDKALQWGDVGEAVFLIPEAALRARDWRQAIFTWDCS